jgi:hypothetical protein
VKTLPVLPRTPHPCHGCGEFERAPGSTLCVFCRTWVCPSGSIYPTPVDPAVQAAILAADVAAPASVEQEPADILLPPIPAWRVALLAATIYLYRRYALSLPFGRYSREGCWYPLEYAACCRRLRQPTRRHPDRLLRHCQTLRHICTRHAADLRLARQWVAWLHQRPASSADYRRLLAWFHHTDPDKFVLTS